MTNRYLAVITACAGIVSFSAQALPVSTDDCLGKGLCAYVSPTGRVTCGKCPGQARTVKVPAGTTAVCKDQSFDKHATRRGSCKGHGGVGVFMGREAKAKR